MSRSGVLDFSAALNKYSDAARANRFSVDIPNVTSLRADMERNRNTQGPINLNVSGSTLQYWCESAELPGRTFATFDRKTYGLTTKLPMQTQFSDITLTFICMANKVSGTGRSARVTPETGLEVKRFFDSWMQTINPMSTEAFEQDGQYNFEYKSDYAVPITITHFDQFSKQPNNNTDNNTESMVSYKVALVDAFPISMGALTMNWGDDGILRLPVTFAYSRWYISDKTGFGLTFINEKESLSNQNINNGFNFT